MAALASIADTKLLPRFVGALGDGLNSREDYETAAALLLRLNRPAMSVRVAKRALQMGRLEGFDVVLLDTAGRLAIDEELMAEVAEVYAAAKPHETLLVADAMTGQDAVTVAKTFKERVNVTGIALTRVDGDARGGAARAAQPREPG